MREKKKSTVRNQRSSKGLLVLHLLLITSYLLLASCPNPIVEKLLEPFDREVDPPVIYNIGDPGPGGGIIFYVDSAGFTVQMVNPAQNYIAHYLEVAPAPENENLQDYQYYEDSVLIPGLSQSWDDDTDRAIGRGRLNTAIIIAHGIEENKKTEAASFCVEYTINGEKDWFLASKEEFNKLLLSMDVLGYLFTSAYPYFSSSQVSDDEIWAFDVKSYHIAEEDKYEYTYSLIDNFQYQYGGKVRPIRAF